MTDVADVNSTLAERRGPLEFSYDALRDELTIEGIRYTGALFRSLGYRGLAVGKVLRIVSRTDGVVTVEEVRE